MLGLLLFFGALTVIMFQALDVYSDDIFSNRLRFRIMFFAWASAFCLLLFMYQGLGLFPYLSSKLVIFWFTGSLLLFGVQRLLVLRLYRAWMKRGMYLQRTVILASPRAACTWPNTWYATTTSAPASSASSTTAPSGSGELQLAAAAGQHQGPGEADPPGTGRPGAGRPALVRRGAHRRHRPSPAAIAGERPAGAGHGCLPACPQPHRRCLRDPHVQRVRAAAARLVAADQALRGPGPGEHRAGPLRPADGPGGPGDQARLQGACAVPAETLRLQQPADLGLQVPLDVHGKDRRQRRTPDHPRRRHLRLRRLRRLSPSRRNRESNRATCRHAPRPRTSRPRCW